MFNKFILPLALLISCSAQASDLIVPAGETYTVTEAQRELHLNKLVMGDKAIIRFAPGVAYWDVTAEQTEIGRDVVIDGRGADGQPGVAGKSSEGRAAECKTGERGHDGAAGTRGANGVDMQLRLHVVKLGSLNINANGGKGGAGGDGGMGQQGGPAGGCNPTAGGEGGNGGNGGKAGNGGKVTVSLTSSGSEGLLAISHRIEAVVDAGESSVGGKAGRGGEGSEGKFINQKTLAGDQKWIAGGKQGEAGKEGEKGSAGQSGRVFIGGGELLDAGAKTVVIKEIAPPPTSAANKDELASLKERLDALEKRIQILEKH